MLKGEVYYLEYLSVNNMQLPLQTSIDVQALSQIFKHTTNSYKYLFFQSLLLLLKKEHFNKSKFSFSEIECEMLDLAEYPITVFKLNFGTQDEVASIIAGKKVSLLKYVPYRLLTPFYSEKLRGMKDAVKNSEIERLSNLDDAIKPIYTIQSDYLIILPEWQSYLTEHFVVIESWCFWHWVKYLQRKNPNALALVNKLRKPSVRSSLKRQTEYWDTVLIEEPSLKCIFSGKQLNRNTVALDHFLPWSFIGHDQLWNLVPILRSANSSKSDNIPDMNKYLDQFIEIQRTALEVTHHSMPKNKWKNIVDDFSMGLNLTLDELESLPINLFEEKYKQTILPLSVVAKNMGFQSNWSY